MGGDKGHSIENSISNSSCVIDAIDSSNSYTVAADAVHLEGSEGSQLVHQMERTWPDKQKELTSLDKPRENGQGGETSLGELREESLPDERREGSLPDERREESLPDERREESLPDEQREQPWPDERREESLPDERREEPWPDERREESLPDERREEPWPDERREESWPDERREESLPDEQERRRSLEGESLNPFDSTTPDGHNKSMEELLGGRNPFDIFQVPNTEVSTNACTHSPTPTRLLDGGSDGRDNPIDYTADLRVQHTGIISTNPFDSPEHSSQPADPSLNPSIGQLYAPTPATDADILLSNNPEDFLMTADDDNERHFTSASPPGNYLLKSPTESAPSSTADSASELAEEIFFSQVDFEGSFRSSAGLEWSVMFERVLTSPSQTVHEATPTDPNQLPILEDYYTAEVSSCSWEWMMLGNGM